MIRCTHPGCTGMAAFSLPTGVYCVAHEPEHRPTPEQWKAFSEPRTITRVMTDDMKTKDGLS